MIFQFSVFFFCCVVGVCRVLFLRFGCECADFLAAAQAASFSLSAARFFFLLLGLPHSLAMQAGICTGRLPLELRDWARAPRAEIKKTYMRTCMCLCHIYFFVLFLPRYIALKQNGVGSLVYVSSRRGCAFVRFRCCFVLIGFPRVLSVIVLPCGSRKCRCDVLRFVVLSWSSL